MALYEVVKTRKVVQDDKVTMLRNVGAIVDLEPDELAAFGDAVRPVGSPDEPATAEPESPEQQPDPERQPDPNAPPAPNPDTPPVPDSTPDPTPEPTVEARRRRNRGEGSDAH